MSDPSMFCCRLLGWAWWVKSECQCGVTGVESSWLAISIDTSGKQFGKDAKWHNITTCASVDFVSEASTLIWSYFSRHGDNCPSFDECINVDWSDVDVFWITTDWVGHTDRGYYCHRVGIWATPGDHTPALAWSPAGSWPSEAE